MSRFNKPHARPAAHSPIATTQAPTAHTHQGHAGYERTAQGELFLLAVTDFGGASAYESAETRDKRYADLAAQVALADPQWLARFVPWLRTQANMRTPAQIIAAEAVNALLQDAGPNRRRPRHAWDPHYRGSRERGTGRILIDAACQRADEPGELLAYWTTHFGRSVPKPVKRGLADAVTRLYTQRSLLKYDSREAAYRFGDVIDLVHPVPGPDTPAQGELFAYALDRRHQRDKPIPPHLGMIAAREWLGSIPAEVRRAYIAAPGAAARLSEAGMTWEALAGWLQGPMDATAWAAIIPSMGYMGLLRNLRNFDQAGVADEVAATVAARLSDPAEVASSRQLPFRFLSAHRAAASLRWAYPLEQALGHALGNIPALPGRTLILVDTSSSMDTGFSKDGALHRWDAAALFGIALGTRCADADLVSFSSTRVYRNDKPGAKVKAYPLMRGESVLRALDRWKNGGWFLGGGTDTAEAIRATFANHDRVVIITDEQAESDPRLVTNAIPPTTPMYTWNLAGDQHGHTPSGLGTRHTFGGLTDTAFRMIPLLEAGRNAAWPF